MTRLHQWLRRFLATTQTRRLDNQTDEELRFHVEMETDAAMRRGLSREQAEREAHLRSGVALAAREAVRDQRGLPWLDDGLADLRISARTLLRQRSFAAVTITALALAVAINTMIFALVDGVLLQPLPYNEPQRLVRVFETADKFPVSAALFLELERDSRTLENIALYTGEDLQLMHDDRPENLTAVRVSNQFFPTLGVQPILGRNFDESEMRGSPHVVILSHSLWVNRFEQDPGIVGRTIRLNRENWTVIGVLPPGFEHVGGAYRSPLQGNTVALWWPVGLDLPDQGMYQWHFMNAVARLKPGITLPQAQQDLERLLAEHEKLHPDGHQGWRGRVTRLDQEVVGGSRQTVLLLISAGGLVLLIACANIAGLCIARGLARRREVAIRQALGARAGRLVRALIAENLLLGIAGGIAGLLLAAAGVPMLKTMLPADFPRLHAIHLSPLVAAFALLSATLTAVLAGLLPAARQTRLDPRAALQEEPRGASAGHAARRLRSMLVASEIALAALLCAATLLLARSAHMLGERDHGFEGSGVLSFKLSLPQAAYENGAARAQLYEELTRRWRQLPGVEAAGLATDLPWTGYDENSGFDIVGREKIQEQGGQGRYHAASPGYFEALRVPLLKGRRFDERDRTDAPPVVLINDSLAQRYFPGEDPVGQVLDLWGGHRQIIGVVADIRDRPSDPQAVPAYWFPISQQAFNQVSVVLKTSADPLAMAPAAAATLRAVDPELPLAEIRTMDAIVDAALAERRFALWLFEAFAVLALALAAVGIYGLLAYLVEQRRKELGIRMALGATRSAIVRMVLGDGARLCAAGALAGLVLVPLAGKGLASFLYGVQPTDSISLLTATLVILMVVLAASLVPAWAAARCHPMSALRDE
jgi:putative ABC transport system permease protein